MPGALQGLKVIELGHVAAVPTCGALLGDWGADVIKIEPPYGEMLRQMRRTQGVSLLKTIEGVEINPVFLYFNRSKRAIAVNLREEKGREIVNRLVEKWADVLISNYEVSVLSKFNLDYAHLHNINPRLVYCVLTGYGQKGPDKEQRGFDYTAFWARGGSMHMIGEPGSAPPPQRGAQGDVFAGTTIAGAVLAALYYRDRTGKGQELHVSLYNMGVWCMSMDISRALHGIPLFKSDRTKAPNPLWNTYCCQDGRWFFLGMLRSDLYWPQFPTIVGLPDVAADPKYSTSANREEHCEELVRIFEKALASKPRAEWQKIFSENDIIHGSIESPEEVVVNPQALANDFFPEVKHPAGFSCKVVGTPVKFSETPPQPRRFYPEIGEHDEEVLTQILGYSKDEVTKLRESEVIV